MKKKEADSSEQQGLPLLLWGIIARPRDALMYISEHGRRTWWLPALLIVLLAITPLLVSGPIRIRQTREEMRASQEEVSERMGQELSEEELERAQAMVTSPLLTVVFPAVGSAVSRVIGWLIWAGALYLVGLALGGRSTFSQMFPVTVWAGFPYALRGLLQTVYILVSGQLIVNKGLSGLLQQQDLSTAGMIASPPGVGQMLLRNFLSRIDLFLAWHLILLIIGVTVTTRLSRRKSALLTVGVWVLLTALSLLPTLASGLFAASRMGM